MENKPIRDMYQPMLDEREEYGELKRALLRKIIIGIIAMLLAAITSVIVVTYILKVEAELPKTMDVMLDY